MGDVETPLIKLQDLSNFWKTTILMTILRNLLK
jgi:hypothetical protein